MRDQIEQLKHEIAEIEKQIAARPFGGIVDRKQADKLYNRLKKKRKELSAAEAVVSGKPVEPPPKPVVSAKSKAKPKAKTAAKPKAAAKTKAPVKKVAAKKKTAATSTAKPKKPKAAVPKVKAAGAKKKAGTAKKK